jgi:hypothetical protein
MTNYRITSQPWQLKAAAEGTLGTIILPLEGLQPRQQPDGTWNYKETWWGESGPHPDYLDEITDFQLSDRIYLAEKWCKGDWGAASHDNIYFVESTTPEAKHMGWQPAETMPEGAARYWFEVTGVRVKQVEYMPVITLTSAGLCNIQDKKTYSVARNTEKRWNAAHPDHPWDADRWVIALDVKELSNENA